MTTYGDMIDHLGAWREVRRGTATHPLARRAILEAYRDLPQMGLFTRYEKKVTFVASAEQTTGTIQYTYTTRVATLSDATWPTDVTNRRLVVDGQAYPVVERLSSTTVRLASYDNPGKDYSAGTAYRLIQDAFYLPSDFRKAVQLMDMSSQFQIPIEARFSPKDIDFLTGESAASVPYRAFITGGNEWGQNVLYVSPPPSSGLRLSLMYHAQPRPLRIDQFSQGTVAIADDGTTATFTFTGGVTLPATVGNGSILRVSSTADLPTSEAGGRNATGTFVDNPAAQEFVITERLTSTACRLATAATDAHTASKFTISDPIDMDGPMLTAFYRLTEAAYLNFVKDPDAERSRVVALQAVKMAKEYDRTVVSQRTGTNWMDLRRRPIE